MPVSAPPLRVLFALCALKNEQLRHMIIMLAAAKTMVEERSRSEIMASS